MPDATEMNDICKKVCLWQFNLLLLKRNMKNFIKLLKKREKSYEETYPERHSEWNYNRNTYGKKHKKTPEEKAAVVKQKRSSRSEQNGKQEARDNLERRNR